MTRGRTPSAQEPADPTTDPPGGPAHARWGALPRGPLPRGASPPRAPSSPAPGAMPVPGAQRPTTVRWSEPVAERGRARSREPRTMRWGLERRAPRRRTATVRGRATTARHGGRTRGEERVELQPQTRERRCAAQGTPVPKPACGRWRRPWESGLAHGFALGHGQGALRPSAFAWGGRPARRANGRPVHSRWQERTQFRASDARARAAPGRSR